MKNLLAILFLPLVCFGQIFIDINQVSNDPFVMAITDLYDQNNARNNLGDKVVQKLQDNLNMLGLFRFIDHKAFLDKSISMDSKTIDFGKWAVLDVMGLIKGKLISNGANLEIELRLFDVLGKKQLLGKLYKTDPNHINDVANRFANDVVKTLTGQPGIFDTQIAYTCKSGKAKEICMMDFDGNNHRPITFDGSISLSPTFDVTGQNIFFTSFNKKNVPQIMKYTLSNLKKSELTKLPSMAIGVSIDPLGEGLLTTLTKDGNSEIYFLSLNGKIILRLTQNADIDVSAKFSPDGKKIAFVSDRKGSVQIFTMNRDGSYVKQITFKGKNNTSPAWSPDGQTLLFAGMDTDGHFDIFSIDAQSKGLPVRLTYDSRDNQEPSFSPGGQMIAFASNRSGQYKIWTMRNNGTNQRQLSRSDGEHSMPSWQIKR